MDENDRRDTGFARAEALWRLSVKVNALRTSDNDVRTTAYVFTTEGLIGVRNVIAAAEPAVGSQQATLVRSEPQAPFEVPLHGSRVDPGPSKSSVLGLFLMLAVSAIALVYLIHAAF